MSDAVLVAVAWPYANAEIHVGNLTGSYLPADIFARYHRLRGRKVLMVSGSDAHGTPITVRADAKEQLRWKSTSAFTTGFLDLFQQLGLTYDLFTSTHTANHFEVSQKIFLALKENGYLYHRPADPVVCAFTEPLPARPLRGRHLLHLRLPQRALRPVRQVRQPARAAKADRPALANRRLDARAARDRALLPRPGQAARARWSTSCASANRTGGQTCCANRWGRS